MAFLAVTQQWPSLSSNELPVPTELLLLIAFVLRLQQTYYENGPTGR